MDERRPDATRSRDCHRTFTIETAELAETIGVIVSACPALTRSSRQGQNLERLRLADGCHDVADHPSERGSVPAGGDERCDRTAAPAKRRLFVLFLFALRRQSVSD